MMDWKDALKNLQASGTVPVDDTPDPEPAPTPSAKKAKLHIAVEKKGRGGKTATIVYGFTGTDAELQALATTLRKRLGTGGSARGGEILLQGNRQEDVARALRELGFNI